MTQDISADEAQRTWDEAADEWDHFVESGLDGYRAHVHGPALLEACGPLAGVRALDLGCGQGWFSRRLAAAGARVTALDWAARSIDKARAYEAAAPAGITYHVLDAAELAGAFAPGSFELVTGCMSLCDMPDVERVLIAAAALLAPGGRVVFSAPNPVTDTPHRAWQRDAEGQKLALELDGYFDAPAQVLHWQMPRLPRPFRTVQYRRTLEGWSRAFEAAGLVIKRLRDPRPTAQVLVEHPELIGCARMPYFLIFELARERGATEP